jgi:hypothetical protein
MVIIVCIAVVVVCNLVMSVHCGKVNSFPCVGVSYSTICGIMC